MLLINISIWLCSLLSSMAAPTDMLTAPVTTLLNCQRKCGNITIPYPFGIGTDCSISAHHNIICDTSPSQPKAFLASKRDIEVTSISETQLKIRNSLTYICYDSRAHVTDSANVSIDLKNSPFTISGTANKFITMGCDDFSVITGGGPQNLTAIGGCISWCFRKGDLIDGACSGLGCCQTTIPNGLWNFLSFFKSFANHTHVWSFNPCSYAFLVGEENFMFKVKELLLDPHSMSKLVYQKYPVVLEWSVGESANCSLSDKSETYACKANTQCSDSKNSVGGYTCHCLPGYEGNPYLGCTDVDECVGPDNPCSAVCTNTIGSYICSCPKGQHGDGLKSGIGCTSRSSQLATKIGLGVSIGLLLAFLCTTWVYFVKRKRGLIKLKDEFFKRNGGLLLKQQISNEATTCPTLLFSAEELKLATKNYSEERIIGTGANGTVYKGILPDNRAVAIKKSKIVDQTQIEQFINEVIILTQIHHRNVVKLLGCCLETEVPLLVYEYISNGTLLDHIRGNAQSHSSWLTWANCLRIASETADALAYLHSAANIPIIHRDVKSANILINECYTARIADFGASRLIPLGKSQVSTLVQGTLGYLDPEYFHTGLLTEKSDVYSFGVVLAELLTRRKPISLDGQNLATLFSVAVEQDWVLKIIHPQLIKEADQEQLGLMARLVKGCINVKRDDRPSMKEVAVKLDELMKKIRHPWARGQDDGVTIMSNLQTWETAALTEQHSMQREQITEMGPR